MHPEGEAAIVVVGSINMDLTARCPHIPLPGETILGFDLVESPGGKGANQAVAAALLGASVALAGCVGADSFGEALLRSLTAARVDVTRVAIRGDRTGVALIEVADNGENNIVVVPAANNTLVPADVVAAFEVFPDARLLLLQLEVPLPVVSVAATIAHNRGMTVILDPAPARILAPELLKHVDVITPNQGEAAVLAGLVIEPSPAQAAGVAERLAAMGPRTVLLKLGRDGIWVLHDGTHTHIHGIRVEVVDTTAAGDCLAGAFAAALAEGMGVIEAARFANAAAASSTTRPGAQASLPRRDQVNALLGKAL